MFWFAGRVETAFWINWVKGSGFGVEGLRFTVHGSRFTVHGSRFGGSERYQEGFDGVGTVLLAEDGRMLPAQRE